MPDSPDRLAKLFAIAGTFIGPLLRSPLHGVLSSRLMMLTYSGRRSSHTYSFPIGYFPWDDGDVLAFSSRNWPKAIRTAGNIHLLIKGSTYDASAHVISGHKDKHQLLAQFAHRKGARTAKRLMLGLPGDRQPSTAELEAAADRTTIVRFSLAPTTN